MTGVLLLSCRMAWLPTYTTSALMHATLYVMPVCAAYIQKTRGGGGNSPNNRKEEHEAAKDRKRVREGSKHVANDQNIHTMETP